jgi:hypothetical protein
MVGQALTELIARTSASSRSGERGREVRHEEAAGHAEQPATKAGVQMLDNDVQRSLGQGGARGRAEHADLPRAAAD